MPFYENVFIARQDISSNQVEGLAETFATIIGENGGQVTKREFWGLKNLTYRMKKNRKGHYVLFNIDAPAAAVHEMERNMRINEDVLRYLTVRVEELEEGPSAMLQSRHRDRDERDGPGGRSRDRDGRGRDRDDRPRRDRPPFESRGESRGEGRVEAASGEGDAR
jgi:small subunit ribosomal protein S6